MHSPGFSMPIPEPTAAGLRLAVSGRAVVKNTHVVPLSHSALFVALLLGLVFGRVGGYNPTYAEPPAVVTVVTEGMAPILKDMSLDEVRGRARDDARRNAIEQA